MEYDVLWDDVVSLDIKFMRPDEKQHRNGEACQARPTCFWSSLVNLMSKGTDMIFCLSCITRIFYFDGIFAVTFMIHIIQELEHVCKDRILIKLLEATCKSRP